MRARRPFLSLFILTWPLIWLACGGGGGGTSAGGGIGGSGVTAAGVVTATGSIYVNGVRYATDAAAVNKEGRPFPSSQLAAGMLVRLKGRIDPGGETGTAQEVEVLIPLRGIITAKNDQQGTILGQTVRVDEETLIDSGGNTLRWGDLETGSAVEISGLVQPNGVVAASRVEVYDVLPLDPKVSGWVRSPSEDEFQMGALTVRFEGRDLVGFGAEGLREGDLVEVSGQSEGAALAAGRVRKLDLPAADSEDVDLEGYLADEQVLISPLGTARLQLNARTIYTGGSGDDLLAGARIQAQGTLTEGAVVATQITFEGKIKVEATAEAAAVDEADPDTGRILLKNLPELRVRIDARTVIQDRRSKAKFKFPEILDTLVNGESLWIQGRLGSEGVLLATQMRVQPAAEDPWAVSLTAPADQHSDGPAFQALGITVNTEAHATAFEDGEGRLLTSDAFFNRLDSGTMVRVRGRSVAENTISAEQISLEE